MGYYKSVDYFQADLASIPGLVDLGRRQPKQLYYRGYWDPVLFHKCIGIVGSRRMTTYGERMVAKIVPELVAAGWTIVSGFMYGVDQAAHKAALECGGKTIAVLGWGIAYKNREFQALEREIIAARGLVISEWEEQEPALWTFPYRNRIVAAISQEIIVVEAAHKSGSLITANMAHKLGRTVWAIPGPLTSNVSQGTNQLIADGIGKIWTKVSQTSSTNKTDLYIFLQNDILTLDELVIKTGRSAAQLGSELSLAVLAGEILEKDGKYFLP